MSDSVISMQGSGLGETGEAPARRIDLLPNCALTPATARLFFGAVALTSLTIATFFVLNGFWPVLPFAGMELGLLAFALSLSLQRRHHYQSIEIDEQHVRITTRGPRGQQEILFSRHWARVTLRGPRGFEPSRLLIESHGKACEVGGFLTEEERRALRARLNGLMGRIGSTPPLGGDAGRNE